MLRRDKTRYDKARHDMTRHDRTRQAKARKIKTRVRRSRRLLPEYSGGFLWFFGLAEWYKGRWDVIIFFCFSYMRPARRAGRVSFSPLWCVFVLALCSCLPTRSTTPANQLDSISSNMLHLYVDRIRVSFFVLSSFLHASPAAAGPNWLSVHARTYGVNECAPSPSA